MKGNKPLNKNKNGNKFSNKKTAFDQGFTFLEFILVVSLLGLTSRLIIPSFINSLNKSRQKEASLIVNSIIKSTKSYYGIHSFLPKNIGQLSKFANYQKCNAKDVADGGRKACKNSLPTLVEKNDLMFFSPSGNYKINMNFSYAEKGPELFLVKANPNGGKFKSEGSAVVGCFNPSNGISFVKEFSGKKSEVGIQDYITCESEEEKKKQEEEKKKQEEEKKKLEEENEKNREKLSSENFEENQNDRDLNMTTQELENMNKLNLKEDETLKSVGDLDENINKSITKTSSQKEINTKKVDLNLKEFDDSTEEKIEGPIPPWIR